MSKRYATFKVSLGEVLRHLDAKRLESTKQLLAFVDGSFPHLTDQLVDQLSETWPWCRDQVELVRKAKNQTEGNVAFALMVLIATMTEIAGELYDQEQAANKKANKDPG